MSEKILFIQLKQIGDCLMTTPAIEALKTARPEAEIHYLTETPSDQLFTYNKSLAKIWLFPKQDRFIQGLQLLHKLRKEKFDLVIDFFGLPKTALLSYLTGAPLRIGFAYRGRSLFYSHPVSPRDQHPYAPFKKLELLEPLGIHAQQAPLKFPTGPKEEQKAREILETLQTDWTRPLISLSPVSRQKYKVWPAADFAWLADRLIQEYKAQILFLWGPGEKHFIQALRREMKEKDLGDYPIPSLGETKALLEKMDLHLGNDNGPMHFAIAAGTPSLAIFGRPRAENWTPPNQNRHLAIEHDPGCKKACHYPHCQLECLRDLKKERVWALLQKQLENQPKRYSETSKKFRGQGGEAAPN